MGVDDQSAVAADWSELPAFRLGDLGDANLCQASRVVAHALLRIDNERSPRLWRVETANVPKAFVDGAQNSPHVPARSLTFPLARLHRD